MEERRCPSTASRHPLPTPFLVAATQNPVEYQGTYPLPEAQLDRFLLKVTMNVPQRDDEIEVLPASRGGFDPHELSGAAYALSRRRLSCGRRDRAVARRSRASPEVCGYIVDIARRTRRARRSASA